MNRELALEHLKAALALTIPPDRAASVVDSTDLIGENYLDSLDTMNFLFQLEKRLGTKLPSIDENYADYRVASLLDIVLKDCA